MGCSIVEVSSLMFRQGEQFILCMHWWVRKRFTEVILIIATACHLHMGSLVGWTFLQPNSSSFLASTLPFFADFLPLGVISHFTKDCAIQCLDKGHVTLCGTCIWNVDDV